MKWIFLIVAGVFEICFAVGLKYTEGFTKLAPSIFTFIGMVGGLYFLSLALKELPLGVAYAIWTGIGTLGA
ncbi:MAG: multidrug efflux SMR transporter, partial [Clostridium sp.]